MCARALRTYIIVGFFLLITLVLAGCAVDRLKLSIDRVKVDPKGSSLLEEPVATGAVSP